MTRLGFGLDCSMDFWSFSPSSVAFLQTTAFTRFPTQAAGTTSDIFLVLRLFWAAAEVQVHG